MSIKPITCHVPLLSLRERVRRWMMHRPDLDGRYEDFQADFNDSRGPIARNLETGEEFIFSPGEVERD